jgi:hypothetical protein
MTSTSVPLRVSLTSALKRAPEAGTPPALLTTSGPAVSIGGTHCGLDGLALPVQPSALSLFGPRGACQAGSKGPLWVSDTGHHRLMGWARAPESDGTPADWVIGQPDFVHEGRNAKGSPGAATLNVPTGITACTDHDAAGGVGLAVADAWNHRILIWHGLPDRHNTPADLVLGQADFSEMQANRGAAAPTAQTLFWPYGIHWDGRRLWVADSGNRRVLMWQGLPTHNAQPADLVLGQRHFECRDENAGAEPSAFSMRWPHGITLWRGRVCVADAGNNRIMVWDKAPNRNGMACDHVLGQTGFALVDNNQSLYWPNAGGLNMPYGIAAAGEWLIAADTANSRLIGWHIGHCATGALASALTAQPDFHAKGDNRWQTPVRDSLCWPYGVSTAGGENIVVSDSGNNRVLLWKLSPGCRS